MTQRADWQTEKNHLYAVDLMRVITVTGVVAVHVVSLTNPTHSVAAGAATIVLHANREIFIFLTALVLAYGARDGRRRPLHRFWARRYWLVGLPYVAWTAIYLLADNGALSPPMAALRQLGMDLLTGAARYHLYFLLVTMQLYLVLPLLLGLVRITRGHHRALLVGSLLIQLAFTAVIHRHVQLPGLLGTWLAHPDPLLPSYQLYILLGAVMVDHLQEVTSWVRLHPWLVAAVVALATLGTVGTYLAAVLAGHIEPLKAAEVFQPAVTIEGLAVILGLYALGAAWARRRQAGLLTRLISNGSDASFGIYLAHPLVLQAILGLAGMTGLMGLLVTEDSRLTLTASMLVVVPLVLALSWMLVWLARQSWFSVALTGRRHRRSSVPVPAAGVAAGAASGARSSRYRRWATYLVTAVGITLLAGLRLPIGGDHTGLVVDQLPSPIQTAEPGVAMPGTATARVQAQPGATFESRTLTVGNVRRTYQVVQPTHPAGPLRVVMVLHGISAGIQDEEQRDGLLPLATHGQAVLVYPVGLDQSWNAGTCCGSAQQQGVDDITFLSKVVNQVASRPGVDSGSVFLVGFSNGGKMAYRLACERPRLVTAMAVVAAVNDGACPPGRPIPLLQVAGGQDPSISSLQINAQISAWRARDECGPASTTRTVGQLTVRRWGSCRDGSGIELATYIGDAHTWPTGGNGTPPTSQLIQEFLTAQRQPATLRTSP